MAWEGGEDGGEEGVDICALAMELARADLFATLAVASERYRGVEAGQMVQVEAEGDRQQQGQWKATRHVAASEWSSGEERVGDGGEGGGVELGGRSTTHATLPPRASLPPSGVVSGLLAFLHEAT